MKKIFNFQFFRQERSILLRAIFGSRRGFTLVELLVAVGLFMITVSIATGGFVQALRTQRQVAALIAANNNVSMVIEQITREVRTGSNFCRTDDNTPTCHNVSGNLANGPNTSDLVFINANGVPVSYSLVNGSIARVENNGTPEFITGSNVSVKYLNFVLSGNLSGDGWSPRVTIVLGISAKESGVSGSVISLQTTVSARNLDN